MLTQSAKSINDSIEHGKKVRDLMKPRTGQVKTDKYYVTVQDDNGNSYELVYFLEGNHAISLYKYR